MKSIIYKISLGALLLGSFIGGCSDDDKSDPVLPESSLTLSGTDQLVFGQEGGNKSFTVTTNRVWSVTRIEGEWIEIEGEASGEAGTATVHLKAGKNTSLSERTAILLVRGGREADTLTVKQFGSEAAVIVADKVKRGVDCDGETLSVIVNTNAGNITFSGDSWIGVEASPYQEVSYGFVITVQPNTGSERSGKVIFSAEGAADTLTLIQDVHTDRYWEISNRLSVSALAEGASLKFRTNMDWSVSFPDGKASWITKATPAQGKAFEESVINFTFSPNEGNERSCKMVLFYGSESKELTLLQRAPVETIDGSRELDSIALAAFYHNCKASGAAPDWNLELPMNKWGKGDVQFDLDGRVIELWVLNAKWAGNALEPLCELSRLRRLEMQVVLENAEIPEKFGQLKNLEKFSLFSQTTDESASLTLRDMSGCRKLTEINLEGFRMLEPDLLGTLEEVTYIRLKRLAIGTGSATDRRPFPSVKNCKKLNMYYATSVNATDFPEGMTECPELASVYITRCQYFTCKLPDLFSKTKLHQLDLSNNAMTGTIQDYVFESPTLVYCWLYNNYFSGTLSPKICDSRLQYFACFGNEMGGGGQLLDERILNDRRWECDGSSGVTSGWCGNINICPQKNASFGWDNCTPTQY